MGRFYSKYLLLWWFEIISTSSISSHWRWKPNQILDIENWTWAKGDANFLRLIDSLLTIEFRSFKQIAEDKWNLDLWTLRMILHQEPVYCLLKMRESNGIKGKNLWEPETQMDESCFFSSLHLKNPSPTIITSNQPLKFASQIAMLK